MGSLSNLYISQSYQSLAHLGTNNALSAGTMTLLQDGIGQSLNISFDGTNISSSGNIYAANITASVINTGSFATTSSLTNLSASLTVTDNYLQSQINALDASGSAVSVASLNAFTASQLNINSGYNIFTSSTNSRLTNIETTTASLNTSISNLNTATASLFTSASLSLTTASFNTGSRNLTFTKGNGTQFSVNIPDVSGSTLPSGVISGSAQISAFGFVSGSYETTGRNIISSSAQITSLGFVSSSVTASSLITASVSGQLLTFTKGNNTQFTLNLPTGSGTYVTGSYGAFHDETTQSGSANTPHLVKFSNTDISDGVILSGSTGLKVGAYGVYNLQFSLQAKRVSGSGTDTLDVWFRKNGIDIPWSNTSIGLDGGVEATRIVPAWNYMDTLNINDTLEIVWQATDANVKLISEPASGSLPAIPSVIATLNRVDVGGGSNSVSTSSFNAYTSSTNSRLNNIESTTASLNISVSNLNLKTGSYATTGSNTFYGAQNIQDDVLNVLGQYPSVILGANIAGSGSQYPGVTMLVDPILYNIDGIYAGFNVTNANTNTNLIAVAGNSYTAYAPEAVGGIFGGGLNAAGNDSAIILRTGSAEMYVFKPTTFNYAVNITGSLNVSSSFTASLQKGYTWVGNGSNRTTTVATSSFATPIPTGTISSSAQITSLGFVSSSVTASSLVTASVSGSVLTFTKGNGTTFSLTLATGSSTTIATGSFAITGSNTFRGNQIISGSLIQSSSNSITTTYGNVVGTYIKNRTEIAGGNGTDGVTARLWITGTDNAETTIGRSFVSIDTTATTGLGAGYTAYTDTGSAASLSLGIYDPNTGNGDTEFVANVDINGTTLSDWNMGTNEYNIWLSVAPNIGDRPVPKMTRGLYVLNSLTISGSTTFVNNSGNSNVFLGPGALTSNTTGVGNTAIGQSALGSNTAGSNNFALGTNALQSNKTGNGNFVAGSGAGQYASGSSNVFIGNNSGQYITGSANTILGGYTGTAGTPLSNNIVLADGNGNVRAQYSGSTWSFQDDIRFNKGTNKTCDIVSVGSTGLQVNNSLVTTNSIILVTTQNTQVAGDEYPACVSSKSTGQFYINHNYGGNLDVAYLIINPTT